MAMDKVAMNDDTMDQVSGGSSVAYSVQPGDSLASIAKKFHVSEDKLRDWNNLAVGQNLGVNQILKIKF